MTVSQPDGTRPYRLRFKYRRPGRWNTAETVEPSPECPIVLLLDMSPGLPARMSRDALVALLHRLAKREGVRSEDCWFELSDYATDEDKAPKAMWVLPL